MHQIRSLKIIIVLSVVFGLSQAFLAGLIVGKMTNEKPVTNTDIVLWCKSQTLAPPDISPERDLIYANCVQDLVEAKSLDEKAR